MSEKGNPATEIPPDACVAVPTLVAYHGLACRTMLTQGLLATISIRHSSSLGSNSSEDFTDDDDESSTESWDEIEPSESASASAARPRSRPTYLTRRSESRPASRAPPRRHLSERSSSRRAPPRLHRPVPASSSTLEPRYLFSFVGGCGKPRAEGVVFKRPVRRCADV